MVENFRARPHAEDVAQTYLAIVGATSGRPTSVIEAALAMALTLIGERHGLTGPALLDWIDTIATAASIAAQRIPLDPNQAPPEITAPESLN
jgi:hypothetical protein